MPIQSQASSVAPLWQENDLRDPHHLADKAGRVRRMFDNIAPTYERVNTLMSLGRDRAWRARAVAMTGITAADMVLDVACGTGDFARAFAAAGAKLVVGADFAKGMLELAARRSTAGLQWCLADALRLPFPGESFTVASCAFGVRNFQSLDAGLREMHRILRPGGRAMILEFSQPRLPGFRALYEWYSNKIMPAVATWISHDDTGAYRYLPSSVRAFVDEAGMEAALRGAGFATVRRRRMTLGVVCAYLAVKMA